MNLSIIGNKLVLLIFVLLLSRSESGQIRCMEEERQALLLFKEGLKDPEGFLSSWRADDCCEWQGVLCSNRTSHVIELNLNDTGLVGVIPDCLGNLSKLQTLDLSYNYDLAARELRWLSHLSSLRYLDLSLVNLSKAHDWSQAVNKLPFLTELTLSDCGLPKITTTSFPLFNSSSMSLSILDLSFNNIGIELSRCHGLFNYSSLTVMDLSYTRIFGPIPKDFGNLKSLEFLLLRGIDKGGLTFKIWRNFTSCRNQLNGRIPEDFGKMKSLEYLDLSGNDLEGGVANFFWRNLTSLWFLDLSANRLYGRIPPNLWKLPELEALILRENQFEGALPDFLPTSLLKNLDISGNELNGTIPESIGSLFELQDLDFSYNRFVGNVSTVHLMNLTKLEFLDLSGNLLVLKFSPNWVPPFNLSWIRLANCKMGPYFPSWLQSQKHLEGIDISGSGIDDAIPKWFWDLSSTLGTMNLSNNSIHGILPDLSSKLEKCDTLDLSLNNIEGPIPKLPAQIVFLYLSKNKFQGPIAPLCDINSSYLAYVDISNNLLTGRIPNCLGEFKQLFLLNLANNKFFGSIPSSIGLLSQIQSLHFRNNNLEGELPTSLQQCEKLSVLDIGQNKFTGKIPIWLGRSLSNLIILSLRSNRFKGAIPSEICYLKNIQILDFSMNNIFGIIPHCLRNFSAMAHKGSLVLRILVHYTVKGVGNFSVFISSYAEDVSLVWKGLEYEYGNTLGLVKHIDLSSNELTGEIPSEITYLEGLVALNISRNKLYGKIPPEIGHLQLLEFLDLSRNQLSGPIPTSLSQLNSIGVLNLSNNNLSGKIPTSTQLQSFNASSYSGNPNLCGLPLPNLCPEDQENFVPGSIQDSEVHEDEMFMNQGFYAALGTGFVVGLCGTLGPLLLHSSWRVAYFRLVANVQDFLYVAIVVNWKRLLNLSFASV